MASRPPNKSNQLYAALAKRAKRVMSDVPAQHNTLFAPSEKTEEYYKRLYEDQAKLTSPQRRPGDATCKYCESFHLQNLKNINKAKDIGLGQELEECFRGFLEAVFTKIGVDLSCVRADSTDLHMPDFKVVTKSGGNVIAYFEFKVIFRPYIMISKRVNASFECYSNSLTLDLSNGKKLLEQRNRVEGQLGIENVFYVYWYDLPCVKGVFWLPAGRVYELMDEQVPYARKVVSGDFNSYGRKNSATKKIYLPLLEMSDFESLVNLFVARAS